MAILIWVHIVFLIMVSPGQSSTYKVHTENDVGTYESNKLGFGFGWNLGGLPSFGIGVGGGFNGGAGDSTGSQGGTGGGVGTYDGGSTNAGFDFGGGGNGYGGGGGSVGIAGDHGGSSRPSSCRCSCERAGGIGGKSNGKKERKHPGKIVTCRPMNCRNENECGGYSKKADGSLPYWCKVSGKGILPFWCTNRGESAGKILNCVPVNCPKGGTCGGDGFRYVLDIPVWIGGRESQNNGGYRHIEPEHN